MKIVFTVYTYYPMRDGVSNVTTYLAEGLAKRGHDVTVVTPSYGNAKEEIHNGVKIIRVERYTIHTIYTGDHKAYRQQIKLLTGDADALICVCTQTTMTEPLLPVLKEIKCKKVLYMHGMLDFAWKKADLQSLRTFVHKFWNNLRFGIGYWYNEKYFREFNYVVQLHEENSGTTFFREKYGIESKIIGNAAEDAFFIEEEKQTNGREYAICVANYLEGKNQELLIRSFYKAKIFDGKLILVGSEKTAYYETLVKLDAELSVALGETRVEFLTGVSREKTIQLIKNATLYLFGSKSEMFPISVVEAIAAGVPYISTNVGCVKSLPGGAVVESEGEMTEWIEKLWKDSKLRRKYHNEGVAYARKELTIGSKVDKLENLLMGEEK